jgi:FkbM family methyltransferase
MLTLIKNIVKPFYFFFKDPIYREYCFLFSRYLKHPRYQPTQVKMFGWEISVPDTLSFLFQFKEIFQEKTYAFESPNKQPVIYDCGANIGLSCIYFKTLFPQAQLHAFEADPDIYRYLQLNLEQNGFKDGVRLYQKAIWINDVGIEFSKEGADGGSVIHTPGSNVVKVPTLRLKDILLKEKIDLLKIDIEGAEDQVLEDCDGSFANVDKVFFEYHSHTNKPQAFGKLLDLMQRNGFRYIIQSPHNKEAPFQNRETGIMDLQLNVYCYKP